MPECLNGLNRGNVKEVVMLEDSVMRLATASIRSMEEGNVTKVSPLSEPIRVQSVEVTLYSTLGQELKYVHDIFSG